MQYGCTRAIRMLSSVTLSVSVLCLLCKLYYGQELCVNQYPCTILHPNIRHPEKLSIQYDQAEMQS